ncbi:MAG: TonB-dependent receptor [Pseudomonadota bacterium]|nr:TonB-dependent receptor [Pseudomonadota bacterium]
MRHHAIKVHLFLSLLASSVWADSITEEGELLALLTLLDQETELATQSKMNADYVPGMVTVLHGSQMQAYGANTVAQALNTVAGFYITANNAGDYVTIVRGVGASLTANNLKMMINGVPVNRPVDGSTDWLMRLPLTQVERIEIIRGPGSSLYGEFAFSGVINILTKEGNQAAIATGNDQYRQADGMVRHQFDSGVTVAANLSHWEQDNSGRHTDVDNFSNQNIGFSPGDIYDHEEGNVVFLDGDYQGYRIRLHLADVERGGWYGRNAAMPEDREPREEQIINLDFDKSWRLSQDFRLGLNFGFLQTELAYATYLPIPAGATPPGRPPIQRNQFRQDENEDESRRARLYAHWDGFQNHQIYIELSQVHSEVTASSITLYPDGLDPFDPGADYALVLAGSERRLTSATVQDQWQILDDLELTLGARLDDYDDWGDATSPRLAMVWRGNDHHVFKFQYAEAFRPPTLADQNPGPDTVPGLIYTPLDAETLKTTELSYLYNGINSTFRSTLFYTEISDLIEFYLQPGRPPRWRNRGDVTSSGLELEWEQQINRNWQWQSNLSYADAEDHLDTDGTLVGSVGWLANLGLRWSPSPQQHHSIWIRYTGTQEGWDSIRPNRQPEFDPYTTLDYCLSLEQLAGIKSLSMMASIHNLTDREYSVLANPSQYPYGLPQGGRSGRLQLTYNFD